MTDIKTMETPNIYFAEWITGVLLGTDEGVIPKNDDSIKILKLRNESYLHLFSIWTRTLKSPSTSMKQQAFKILSSILQKVLKLNEHLKTQQDLSKYLEAVPTLRLFSMAARRIYRGLEDHPLYSTYSKSLVEFTGLLQLIKSKSQGSNDVTLNDDFQGIENGNFVLSLSSRSYISVSLSTHTMPDKSVPWTAEFWIKRGTMDDGEKNEDSLKPFRFLQNLGFIFAVLD